MTPYEWLSCVPMLALLVWAAAVDLHCRRIPNWLTFGLITGGMLQSLLAGAWLTPGEAGLGLLAGFGLTFVLFGLGALGGGDVKLLSGVGAWVGAALVLQIFLAAAVVGMCIVLVQSLVQRRTGTLLRNSAVVTLNLMHLGDVGIEHASQSGQACRSVQRPLPYAVPVLAAVLVVLAWH